MARATGEDPAAGLPEEDSRPRPSSSASTTRRRRRSRRRSGSSGRGAPRPRPSASPELGNSDGGSFGAGEDAVVLANTSASSAATGRRRVAVGRAGAAARRPDGARLLVHGGPRPGRPAAPEEVGRIAAERTLRRLERAQGADGRGARGVRSRDGRRPARPRVQRAVGLRRVPQRDLPEGPPRRDRRVAAAHVVDDGRRPRGLGSRPFDGEGLPTRRNVPLERGVLRHYLCDSYAARKLGTPADGQRATRRRGRPLRSAPPISPSGRARRPRRRSSATWSAAST